eukprot:g25805.t1
MSFADVLETVGSVGKFQIIHIFLLAIPVLFMASHNLLQNFVAVVPDHHCRVQFTGLNESGQANAMGNLQMEGLLHAFIPLDPDGQLEKCLVYSSPQWHLLNHSEIWENATGSSTR